MNENLENFGNIWLGQNLVRIKFDCAKVRKRHLQNINLERYCSANQPG
jgi:hypothetical protein